jgi:FAD/FMN-containing dehydrogenase
VTGVCELVGLLSDQILSIRLILTSGSLLTLSATSHPALFWGLLGAGHNIGSVTSLDYKIYPIDERGVWSYEDFVFDGTEQSVRALYREHERQMGSQPSGLFHGSEVGRKVKVWEWK